MCTPPPPTPSTGIFFSVEDPQSPPPYMRVRFYDPRATPLLSKILNLPLFYYIYITSVQYLLKSLLYLLSVRVQKFNGRVTYILLSSMSLVLTHTNHVQNSYCCYCEQQQMWEGMERYGRERRDERREEMVSNLVKYKPCLIQKSFSYVYVICGQVCYDL